MCEPSGLLSTTNPKASNTSWCTILLSQNSSSFPFSNPLIYSQCKFFQNNLYLSSPNSLYERAPSAPGRWTDSLLPAAPLLVVQTACPRTWSFFWLACGSINPLFKTTFSLKHFLKHVSSGWRAGWESVGGQCTSLWLVDLNPTSQWLETFN